MKKLLAKYLVSINYVLATSFFGFYAYAINPDDIVGLISLLFFFCCAFAVKKTVYKNFIPFFVAIVFLLLVDMVASYYSYGQDVIFSISASRIFIIALFLFFLIESYIYFEKKINIRRIALLLAVVLIPLHYGIYFNGDMSVINIKTTERFGEIRFLIASATVFFLLFYFYHTKTSFVSLFGFIFLSLVGIILLISKTRAFIIALLLLFILDIFIKVYRKNTKYFLQILLFLFFAFLVFNKPIIDYGTRYYDSLESDVVSANSNISIREEAFLYYFNRMEGLDFVFGRGIENKLVSQKYEEKLTLSDIGIFKVIYNHGLIGLILVVLFFVTFYKRADQKNTFHQAIRSFIVFQVLISPTIIFIYSIEGLMVNLFLYGVVSNEQS